MSAPDTNLEKQKRRHVGPLIGMALTVLVVIGMFLGYLVLLADEATRSAPSAEQPPATSEG